MGTVYLIDAHNPILANSEINDTIPLEAGDSLPVTGSFPVNVPFGTPVDGNPTDLTDLITKKFSGLLAYYPGFTYVDYEDGLDATGWDTTVGQGFKLGERMSTFLIGSGFTSNAVALTGAAPSEVIVTWELYELTKSNPKDGLLTREYQESDATDCTVEVSFNGGSTWNSVTDGVLFPVPLIDQGTSFLIRFQALVAERGIGSWAVLY